MELATAEERAEKIVAQRGARAVASSVEPVDAEAEKRITEFTSHRREVKRWLEQYFMVHAAELTESMRGMSPYQCANGAVRPSLPPDVLDAVESIGMDDKELSALIARCQAIVSFKAVAGTRADRIAARERMQLTEAAHVEQSPLIQAEINRLTGELNGLKRDRDQAAADVTARQNAVVELRKCAPQHAKDQNQRALSTIDPMRDDLNEARIELDKARHIAGFNIEGDNGIAMLGQVKSICRSNKPELLTSGVRGDELNVPGWLKFREKTAAKIPALEAKVAELTATLETLEAQTASDFLDVYSQD